MACFLFALFTIVFSLTKCEKEVYWEVTTDVFQYGKDARLKCSGHQCTKDVTKLWMGGFPYNLLCTDKRSINPGKYQLQPEEDGNAFDLMIKNISKADANCSYTCTCGFHHFTRNLSALDLFLYPPNTKPINSSVTKDEDIYLINVNILRVYPLPQNCTRSLVYEGKIFHDDLVVKGANENAGTFSNLQIQSRLDCMAHQSQIDVNISCTVQGRIFTVFTEKVDCIINRRRTTVYTETIIIALVTSCLLAMTVVFVCIFKWKQRRQDPTAIELPKMINVFDDEEQQELENESQEKQRIDEHAFLSIA